MKLAFFVTISVIVLSGCITNQSATTVAATPEGNTWDGRYRLSWMEGPAASAGAPDETLSIARAPDADPAEEPKDDLARWILSVGEAAIGELHRFHPDDYKGFGMASLYAAGGIECLYDGSHFFVCRVKPGTTVVFEGNDTQEKLLARTGFFGAMLHAGSFELTKLDLAP